ncbi:MarR family winged helix-turn-helix transcriptional regulator [Tranquillimonas alkanivorans]|uniref:DNA-binding transcriptional regulator, MarR family n=1 Tax=Tranquillimonas alkanivorans TaxID=441119 RepID=A0A1I5UN27_9RHOB|nr:MarR family transcriptional regulator [Tranquillimonas alkanivorans]SFP96599.1 DNA-binding transcriptional regulator, MarR family [Tranquillimonas alkanivorans]
MHRPGARNLYRWRALATQAAEGGGKQIRVTKMAEDASGSEAVQRPDVSLGEIGLWHFAPYLMNRIMGRYNANIQSALKAQNLTTAKMRTLAVLAVVPGLTINELSVYAVTEQSTMSRTLEALEKAGLVRRQERESDARVREVYLTDKGRHEFDRVWPTMHARYEEMFAGVSQDERAAFVGTLQKMLKNVRRHEL